jgi:hypothetical protein
MVYSIFDFDWLQIVVIACSRCCHSEELQDDAILDINSSISCTKLPVDVVILVGVQCLRYGVLDGCDIQIMSAQALLPLPMPMPPTLCWFMFHNKLPCAHCIGTHCRMNFLQA